MFDLDLYEALPAHLLFVRTVTDRATHLEYFSMSWDGDHDHWKWAHGEWVPCNKAEFPKYRKLRKKVASI